MSPVPNYYNKSVLTAIISDALLLHTIPDLYNSLERDEVQMSGTEESL